MREKRAAPRSARRLRNRADQKPSGGNNFRDRPQSVEADPEIEPFVPLDPSEDVDLGQVKSRRPRFITKRITSAFHGKVYRIVTFSSYACNNRLLASIAFTGSESPQAAKNHHHKGETNAHQKNHPTGSGREPGCSYFAGRAAAKRPDIIRL